MKTQNFYYGIIILGLMFLSSCKGFYVIERPNAVIDSTGITAGKIDSLYVTTTVSIHNGEIFNDSEYATNVTKEISHLSLNITAAPPFPGNTKVVEVPLYLKKIEKKSISIEEVTSDELFIDLPMQNSNIPKFSFNINLDAVESTKGEAVANVLYNSTKQILNTVGNNPIAPEILGETDKIFDAIYAKGNFHDSKQINLNMIKAGRYVEMFLIVPISFNKENEDSIRKVYRDYLNRDFVIKENQNSYKAYLKDKTKPFKELPYILVYHEFTDHTDLHSSIPKNLSSHCSEIDEKWINNARASSDHPYLNDYQRGWEKDLIYIFEKYYEMDQLWDLVKRKEDTTNQINVVNLYLNYMNTLEPDSGDYFSKNFQKYYVSIDKCVENLYGQQMLGKILIKLTKELKTIKYDVSIDKLNSILLAAYSLKDYIEDNNDNSLEKYREILRSSELIETIQFLIDNVERDYERNHYRSIQDKLMLEKECTEMGNKLLQSLVDIYNKSACQSCNAKAKKVIESYLKLCPNSELKTLKSNVNLIESLELNYHSNFNNSKATKINEFSESISKILEDK